MLARPVADDVIGGTVLDAITAERLDRWTAAVRSPTTNALRTRVARQLLHPIEVPDGADPALAPLQTILEAAGDVIALTANHTLDLALVRDLADRFGWALPGFRARGEVDEILVHQLHRMVKRSRLARRTGRKLVLMAKGQTALADPVTRWEAATASLVAGEDFDAAVTGFALTAMLDGVEELRDVERVVTTMCVEQGWAAGADRTPMGEREAGLAASAGDAARSTGSSRTTWAAAVDSPTSAGTRPGRPCGPQAITPG